MSEKKTGRKWRLGAASGEQLMLVAPLFLFYHVGLLFAERAANGVDFFTRIFGALVGWSLWPYLLFCGLATAAYLFFWRRACRSGSLRRGKLALALLESLFYAAAMGPLALLVLHQTRLLATQFTSLGIFSGLVASAGAGFYEELVFRLGALGGPSALFSRGGKSRWRAVLLSVAISAPLFSLAHHLGAGAEPFTLAAFLFRTLLGVMFSAIYLWRGFAQAAWSHFFYDVFVLFLGRA